MCQTLKGLCYKEVDCLSDKNRAHAQYKNAHLLIRGGCLKDFCQVFSWLNFQHIDDHSFRSVREINNNYLKHCSPRERHSYKGLS